MISKIFSLIEKKQRVKFWVLSFLVLILGFFEIIGVSALIPFLDLASKGNADEIDGLTKRI